MLRDAHRAQEISGEVSSAVKDEQQAWMRRS
jgi:hypothetical protein